MKRNLEWEIRMLSVAAVDARLAGALVHAAFFERAVARRKKLIEEGKKR